MLWPVLNVPLRLPRHENVTPEQAERILNPLIRNVYRAFDQRSESGIYDVLERSIDGNQLQKTYLETTQALALDAQDKTRVRVTDLGITVEVSKPSRAKTAKVSSRTCTGPPTVRCGTGAISTNA